MTNLELKVGKGYKKFKVPKDVSIETLLLVLKLEEDMNSGVDLIELIPKCITCMCSVYEHQFTEKDLSRGISYRDILPLTSKTIDHVIENTGLSSNIKEPPEDLSVGKVVFIESSRKNRT